MQHNLARCIHDNCETLKLSNCVVEIPTQNTSSYVSVPTPSTAGSAVFYDHQVAMETLEAAIGKKDGGALPDKLFQR